MLITVIQYELRKILSRNLNKDIGSKQLVEADINTKNGEIGRKGENKHEGMYY